MSQELVGIEGSHSISPVIARVETGRLADCGLSTSCSVLYWCEAGAGGLTAGEGAGGEGACEGAPAWQELGQEIGDRRQETGGRSQESVLIPLCPSYNCCVLTDINKNIIYI